jgi:diguanylate cyclase (GGDEF)-like protein/PAS domain S-box-containing protein
MRKSLYVSVRPDHTQSIPALVLAEAIQDFPGALVVFDHTGLVRFASPAESLLASAVHGDNLETIMDLVEPALKGGLPRLGTVQLAAADGQHSFDLSILPLSDGGVTVLAHDVTLHTNLRSALMESRQRYKDFVEISADFAWETGIDGTFLFVSPRGALGHAAASLIGRDPADLVMERDPGVDLPFSTRVAIEGQEIWLRQGDGATACVMVSAKPVYDRLGRWTGARGVCRDVTLERDRDSELIRARNRERILNHVVRTFRDEVDPQNMLRVAAATLARGMGAESCQIYRRSGMSADSADLAGEGIPMIDDSIFLPGARHGSCDHLAALTILDRLDNGEPFIDSEVEGREVLAAPCHYRHRINGAVILWRAPGRGPWGRDDRLLIADIADQIGIANEQISAHEDIVRLSRTDGLTGLFNRRAFFEEAERRYQRLQRNPDESAALMYVDLDNFKHVNDIHGHAAGDAVLCSVRDLLIASTRPTDLVARLGGDEFAIWLETADTTGAISKAETLLKRAAEDLTSLSGAPDRPLGLSIGIAVYTSKNGESMHELIARADQAMYAIKHGSKGGYAIAPTPNDTNTESGDKDQGFPLTDSSRCLKSQGASDD